MIEIAPRSCRMSSAAIVSLRIRLSAKATSSGISRVEVVADHEHVEMLVDRVDRVGPGRVGRGRAGRWRRPHDLDDVGRMAAAGALGVEGVDRAALEGGDGVLDEARFVRACRCGSATCTSISSATDRQQSIAAGVVPQSSCSLSAQAPAATCSTSASGRTGVALAEQAEVDRPGLRAPAACGRCARRRACRWWRWCRSPGRCRRRACVVMPRSSASSICCGQMKWMWQSMPPAVTILPSPAIASVPGPMTMSTPGWVSGLPALPMRGDAAVLEADVGLDDAPMVEDQRVGDDGVDGARRRGSPAHWPMPSRITLPPPNLTSSP